MLPSNYNRQFKVFPDDPNEYDSFPTYGHPPESYYNIDITRKPDDVMKKKPTSLIINSAFRNMDLDDIHGTQDYRVELRSFISDVKHLRIHQIDIPASRYIIHSYNNVFRFQETTAQNTLGTYHEIEIDVGDYTGTTLATELQTEMNNVGVATYTVSYNSATQKFTITQGLGGDLFNILFTDGQDTNSFTQYKYIQYSIGRILGFRPYNLLGVAGATVVSDLIADFSEDEYLLLAIENMHNIEHLRDSKISSDIVCPVYYESSKNKYTYTYNGEPFADIELDNYTEISKLHISLYDQYGHPYETNGINHSIILSIFSNKRV